jgi:pimeloyl-ACP methyl ester carboxylesterase
MDRRGFGRSTGAPRFAGDADDVLALLDERRVERAAVLGMSQGARIALELAQRAPERVSALILDGAPGMDALPGGPWLQETPLDRYRRLLADEGIEALRAELAAHPLMQLCTREPAPRKALEAMLARYSGADLADPTAAQASRPMDPARLRVPALILNGERDTAQRLAAGAALGGAIPGATRRIIPEAGHLACLDQPAIYGRIVSDFLDDNAHSLTPEESEIP